MKSTILTTLAIIVVACVVISGVTLLEIRSNRLAHEAMEKRDALLGKPFVFMGKTYVAAEASIWDGTLRCVSANGPEQWMDQAAVRALQQMNQQPEKE